MILLRQDCLEFKTASGESIPCSAHAITVEIMGGAAAWMDQNTIENAATAVLHYFKIELGKQTVTVSEFTEALERVLRGLGLHVNPAPDDPPGGAEGEPRVVESDLLQLAGEVGAGGELCFFPRLRETVRRGLDGSTVVLRFRGLRGCVKLLAGTKRWTGQCQSLHDQIVEYLRQCFTRENTGDGSALLVT